MTDEMYLFRCTECGYLSTDLGWLHGHIEKHRGYTPLNIQLPLTKTAPANVEELMARTEILRVDEATEVSLEDVPGY